MAGQVEADKVGFVYINGLNDGQTKKDNLVRWWWEQGGHTLQLARINWHDGGSLDEKVDQVEAQVYGMLGLFGGAALIGSSAGGGLVLNAYAKMKKANIVAISAHGRMKEGDYSNEHRMSIRRRAHIGTSKASPAFVESIARVEHETIPGLSPKDRERILNLTQLTDMVVAPELMQIPGVQTHRSLAFGHTGAFFAHLFADRDLIARFAQERLIHA